MPQYHQLRDAEWLRQRYERDGATLSEIAQEIGCTDSAVLHGLRRANIASRSAVEQRMRRGTSARRIFAKLGDREWLEREYGQRGRSFNDIAVELGCTGAAVRKACKEHAIPARSEINRVFRGKVVQRLGDPQWLRHERVTLGKAKEQIAAELGCSVDAVQKALWRHHVRVRNIRPRGSDFDAEQEITYTNKGGYVFVWMPSHPAAQGRGVVPQHRLVAERELSRLLRPKEVVHHLNENPSDNRPENLMVFATNGAHMSFHANPPVWVPRCNCCGKPNPEVLDGRPLNVPMEYRP